MLLQPEVVNGPVIAVLVFSCNRVTVQRCLDALIKYRPSKLQFPIVVTQDCDHEPTAQVIDRFGDNVTHIRVSHFCSLWDCSKYSLFFQEGIGTRIPFNTIYFCYKNTCLYSLKLILSRKFNLAH